MPRPRCRGAVRATVLRRVRPVVDGQAGVVTAAQLRELRVDAELPRRERWTRLADGLWCVAGEPTDEQLITALGLYAPTAVPSGALACRWHGLRYAPRTPGCDAVAPHGTTLLGGPLLRVHQSRRPPTSVDVRGRQVATVARAVADASRWTPSLRDVRALLLAALGDRRLTAAAAEEELQSGARRAGARGQRALQDWHRGARSAPEAEAADALLVLPDAAGLPPFLLNPELALDGVPLGSPDGWIPAAALGWEMDSVEFHGDAESLDATLQRHQRFDDAGLTLLHVSPSRFRAAPAAWALDVAQRAGARVLAGAARPSGLTVVPRGPVLGGSARAA